MKPLNHRKVMYDDAGGVTGARDQSLESSQLRVAGDNDQIGKARTLL